MEPPSVERRRYNRRNATFAVSLRTAEAVNLAGDTVNLNEHSVYLHARGHLPVVVSFRNRVYRGRLVRAIALGDDTAFAVELGEVETGEPSRQWSAFPGR